MSDRIEELVTQAHTYFNQTLTAEVVDMDYESAVAYLNKHYDFPSPKLVEKYLAVVEKLR